MSAEPSPQEPRSLAEMHAAHLARQARMGAAVPGARAIGRPTKKEQAALLRARDREQLRADELARLCRRRVDLWAELEAVSKQLDRFTRTAWARIVDQVAIKHNVCPADLLSHKRGGALHWRGPLARGELVYRLRAELGWSLPHIGKLMDGRDHSSVAHLLDRYCGATGAMRPMVSGR